MVAKWRTFRASSPNSRARMSGLCARMPHGHAKGQLFPGVVGYLACRDRISGIGGCTMTEFPSICMRNHRCPHERSLEIAWRWERRATGQPALCLHTNNSLFEKLVTLGYSYWLLNIQYCTIPILHIFWLQLNPKMFWFWHGTMAGAPGRPVR